MKKRGKDKKEKRADRHLVKYLIILFLGILLISFVDYIVLEKIYHPISQQYSIPWTDFMTTIPIFNFQIMWWHIAFIVLEISLFVLIGIAASSWRLSLSGIALFGTGWEDAFYYLIQGKFLPTELPWLNTVPTMTWTRLITGTANITSIGLIISAIVGAFIVFLLLYVRIFEKKK
jgi:hypothetical protein